MTTGSLLPTAAACVFAAAGCGPGPLVHGVGPADRVGVTNRVAATAIDEDPPADGLFVHCRFQGVSLRLDDVYTCPADYEGASVTLRLEHDRLARDYRYRVLESGSRWIGVGARGVCVYDGDATCR